MRSYIAFAFASGLTLGLLHDAPSIEGTDATEAPSIAVAAAGDVDVEQMLTDFAEDFRGDGTASPIIFGIEVRDAEPSRWHAYVGDRLDGELESPVELAPGFPPEPVPYFTTDVETLTRIHRGELASLTAMGKSFSTDFAPLDLESTAGFQADAQTEKQLLSLSFHFWTRGFPEVVRFGDPSATRTMHGANGVLFYYQKGFRSGYVRINPGEHVNENPLSQTNPFPTLLVITKGQIETRIGTTECILKAGEAVVIAPDVHHEFWLSESAREPAEGVLLMFGDGA